MIGARVGGTTRAARRASKGFLKTYQTSGSAQRPPREPRQAGNGATVAAAACVAGQSGVWPHRRELPRARLAEARRVGAQSSASASFQARAARGNSFLFG